MTHLAKLPRNRALLVCQSDETKVPRVERGEQGQVTFLILNEMELSSADVADLAGLSQLRRLVLFRTNFSDQLDAAVTFYNEDQVDARDASIELFRLDDRPYTLTCRVIDSTVANAKTANSRLFFRSLA